jgi:hypothetical protein
MSTSMKNFFDKAKSFLLIAALGVSFAYALKGNKGTSALRIQKITSGSDCSLENTLAVY